MLPADVNIPDLDDVTADRNHDNVDAETRSLTSAVAGRMWSVFPPTRTPTVGDRSAVERREQDGALNLLYIGVPAACACVLLSLAVLGVLLIWYGRDRPTDARRKSAALLPLFTASLSSPSPLPQHPSVELSQSHEPRACLHCSRPIFPPTSAALPAYDLMETRS